MDELTPEEIETLARDKQLANECAKWRHKYRDAEKKIARLSVLVGDLAAFVNAYSEREAKNDQP